MWPQGHCDWTFGVKMSSATSQEPDILPRTGPKNTETKPQVSLWLADRTTFCCRAPWRLATYWAQTQDERILPLVQAQQQFFESQEMISAGYKLDGTPLESYSNIAFLAPVWCLFKVWEISAATCHACAVRMLCYDCCDVAATSPSWLLFSACSRCQKHKQSLLCPCCAMLRYAMLC